MLIVLIGERAGKRPLGKPRRRWKYNASSLTYNNFILYNNIILINMKL